ncbi:MAG: tyrosine-type recombinase/integrase [Candidatus Bathyarchaeia archaeon]|jgi:integrase/predicted RNA-binding Zn-ribbon protein involved in translation (DUF1610 family)
MADFHIEPQSNGHVLGKASSKGGKSGVFAASAGVSPLCPECGSQKVWRDGLRNSLFGHKIQRWLCRNCGFRFSDSENVQRSFSTFERVERVGRDSLKARFGIVSDSQIRVTKAEGTKNLASATETQTVAGDRKLDKATAKGLLLQYSLYLQKEGYGENCSYVNCIRTLINSEGCNIYDPENVKEVIGKKKWKDGTKMMTCYAYDAFTRMAGLSWAMPTYRQEEYLFFLPEENELDTLINASRSARMRTYLQCLKETFGDPSEVLGIRWEDVDAHRSVIAINHPVKGHNAGELEVSPRLLHMLDALPKTSKLIFPTTYRNMLATYVKLRKRLAHNLQNPRMLSISFVSFRHWAGTQLAWLFNGNMLIVKEKLRHKDINSTMKYVRRIKLTLPEDFDVFTASTDEEIKKMGILGAQKYDERTIGATTISYYRRPKRFGSIKV